MHVKKVIVTVQDENGQTVPGGQVRLRTVDGKAQKKWSNVGDNGVCEWNDAYFPESLIVVEYKPPAGYELVELPPETPLASDMDEIPLLVRARTYSPDVVTTPAADQVATPPTAAEYGRVAQAGQSARGPYPPPAPAAPSAPPPYAVAEYPADDYDTQDDWDKIVDACGLRNDLRGSGEALSQGPDGCDGDTQRFLEAVSARIDELADECRRIAPKQAELDAFTDYGQAARRLRLWDTRLGDVMTAYGGLIDLLLLEVESGQIPRAYYDEHRADLDRPLESYQCCRRLTSDFIYRLGQGPVGACLADLVAAGDELDAAFNELRLDMNRRARAGAPTEVKALSGQVERLGRGFEVTLHGLKDFAAHYTPAAGGQPLAATLDQLVGCRDAVHSLIGGLRHSFQDRPAPTAWRDGPNWIADAKVGLTGVWSGLTAMISGARDCQALTEGAGSSVSIDISLPRSSQVSRNVHHISQAQTAKADSPNGGSGGGAGAGSDGGDGGGAAADGDDDGDDGRTIWPAIFGGPNPTTPATPARGGENVPILRLLSATEDARDSLRDLATFTPTVNDGGGWAGGSGSGNGGDSGFYGRRIAQVYASLTGQPLPHDPNAFWNSLRATFPVDPLTGQIVAEPVRGVVSLYNDTGPLSSAQATLRQFSGLVIPDAHKLLNGLHSIDPDTDDERAGALSAIIGHSFDVLADEAARGDRPRSPLVDDVFDGLLGSGSIIGHIDNLRDELGLNSAGDTLTNPNLVTTEEAQLMGNISLLEEYAVSLRDAYDRYFATPTGQDPRNGSFSGRAAYVSLLFSVVAHSVQEVEEAMSAANFSQPERRTTFITDPASGTLISIDSILQWIANLMVNTGPRLLQDSGLIGLNQVLQTIDTRIDPMVDELLAVARGTSTTNPPPAPHPGLTHSRVRNALAQLDSQIEQF